MEDEPKKRREAWHRHILGWSARRLESCAVREDTEETPPLIPNLKPVEPLPSQSAEHRKLWEQHWSGDKLARNELVEKYFPLVEVNSQAVIETILAAIEESDFKQAAVVGYLESVDQFKPGNEFTFEEFSSLKIREAILDELANYIKG